MDPKGDRIAPARRGDHRADLRPAGDVDRREPARGGELPRPDRGRPGDRADHPSDRGHQGQPGRAPDLAETQKLLDELSKDYQKLIDDLVPSRISVGGIQRVLQTLLAERVSIRDLALIVEAIGEAAAASQNVIVHHRARPRAPRPADQQRQHRRGRLHPDPHPVAGLGAGVRRSADRPGRRAPAGDGALAAAGVHRAACGRPSSSTRCAASCRCWSRARWSRPYVRSIIERFRPATVVLSQNEIHAKARIRTLGQV